MGKNQGSKRQLQQPPVNMSKKRTRDQITKASAEKVQSPAEPKSDSKRRKLTEE